MDVAALLREARERSLLTQEEVAVRAGVSRSRLACWESGNRLPSLTSVARVLAVYDLQLGLSLQPRYVEHDAAIHDLLRKPARRRLDQVGARLLAAFDLLVRFTRAEVLVDGALAARLHGAPLLVAHGDLLLPAERLLEAVLAIRRTGAGLYDEVRQMSRHRNIDPEELAEDGRATVLLDGHVVRLRVAADFDALRSRANVVGGEDAAALVLALGDVQVDEGASQAVLDRVRELRTPPP